MQTTPEPLRPWNSNFIPKLIVALRRDEVDPRQVGAGFVVFGALLLFGAATALVSHPPVGVGFAAGFQVIDDFVTASRALAPLQVALALLSIGSGFALRRKLAWSRVGLDLVTVSCSIGFAAMGFVFIWALVSMLAAPVESTMVASLPVILGILIIALTVFTFGSFLVLGAMLLKYLHGPRVAEFMTGRLER